MINAHAFESLECTHKYVRSGSPWNMSPGRAVSSLWLKFLIGRDGAAVIVKRKWV